MATALIRADEIKTGDRVYFHRPSDSGLVEVSEVASETTKTRKGRGFEVRVFFADGSSIPLAASTQIKVTR